MASNSTNLDVNVNIHDDQVAPSEEKFKSLRRQIRETLVELQALTDAGDTQGKKFTELNLKLAELRTEQEQVNNKTQSLTSTFSLMGGAVGEFSDKAEIGIQALKTISSFTLQDIKNQFMVVGQELKTFVGKIADATGITKLYTITNEALAASFIEMGVAEEAAASAASVLSGAIVATGIGAIIVGVALLAANWDKVEESLKGTTEQEELYNQAVEKTNKDIEKFYENLTSVKQTLEAAEKGVISKKEALKIYNETLGDSLGKVKTFEEAEKRANSPEAVTAYVQAQVKKAEAQILLAKSAQAAADAATGKGYDLSWWEKLKNAVVNAGNPVGYLVDNLKDGAENTKELLNTAKTSAEEYAKFAPKGAEAKKEKENTKVDPRIAQAKTVQAELDKIAEDAYAKTLSDKDRELYVEGEKYNTLLNKAKSYGLDTTALTEAYHTNIDVINKKYDDKQLSEDEKKRKAIEQFEVKLAADLQKIEDKKKADKIKNLDDDVKLLQAQEASLLKGSKAYFDVAKQIEDKSYEERKLKAEGNAKDLEAIEITHKNNVINIKQQQIDAETQIQLESVNMYASIGNLLGQIAGKNKELAIAALLIEKATAIATVVINTNAAIAKYAESVAGAGPIGDAFLAAYTIKQHISEGISIASIVAAAAIGVAGISGSGGGGGGGKVSAPSRNSTSGKQGYADGGMIYGNSHAQGGVNINAQGGEAVMTRGAVTMFGPMLSMMNQAGGGTAFNKSISGMARYDNPKSPSNPSSEQQVIKTYVVASELNTMQHKQARLKDLSTL